MTMMVKVRVEYNAKNWVADDGEERAPTSEEILKIFHSFANACGLEMPEVRGTHPWWSAQYLVPEGDNREMDFMGIFDWTMDFQAYLE